MLCGDTCLLTKSGDNPRKVVSAKVIYNLEHVFFGHYTISRQGPRSRRWIPGGKGRTGTEVVVGAAKGHWGIFGWSGADTSQG